VKTLGPDGRPSAELEFLLACARLRMRPSDIERANAALRIGVDWQTLLALAAAHGLLGLVHEHATRGTVPVPTEPLAALRAHAVVHAKRSLRLAGELVGLLTLCAEHAIPVLPLKGPVLAQIVYGSFALRSPRDLDLLFRASDVQTVCALLTQRGYAITGAHVGELNRQAFRTGHHLASAVSPRGAIRVELHHALTNYGGERFTLDRLEERLHAVPFNGVQASAFHAEEQLVYLCQHGAGHAWSRLEWLATVAELAQWHVRDWNRVWTWAAEWNGVRRVRAALLLARDLLGASEAVGHIAEDRWIRAANRAVAARVFREPERFVETQAEGLRYQLRVDSSFPARLRRCWLILFAPTPMDIDFVPLPRPLWLLYAVIRPLRLVIRQLVGQPR
jgi:hypothetical protein